MRYEKLKDLVKYLRDFYLNLVFYCKVVVIIVVNIFNYYIIVNYVVFLSGYIKCDLISGFYYYCKIEYFVCVVVSLI